MRHPPFTFRLGKCMPGSLEAVGYIGGHSVTHHRVITPGVVERVAIEFDNTGVCVDGERGDQIFVRARLLDPNGTTVPISGREVEFSAGGRFAILGPTKLVTEAGIATALLQVTPGDGDAQITASSGEQRRAAIYREPGCRRVFLKPE